MAKTRDLKYTQRLGRVVARETKAPGRLRRFHVISSNSGSGWSVVHEGSVRSIKGFKTQKAAIGYATRLVSKSAREVFVHGRDGRIENKIAVKPK